MAIRPATPGTIVVFAATVLLILVSVSVPILKSIYFLKATVGGVEITFGAWGYCTASNCPAPSVGYSLDLEKLFAYEGVSGISLTDSIPTTLVKWLTYVLVLHPVAAVFGLVSTILGLLAHLRGFQGTCFTTCMASFGATIALIAFAFDLGLFIVAKKRIESSSVGGSAELGAALWMTLVAALMLMFSGCFFGCGKCIVRDRKSKREASESTKPQVDTQYGAKMRDAALQPSTNSRHHGKEGSLPVFADRYGEAIPLNSMHNTTDDDWDDYNPQQPRYPGGYAPGGAQRDNASLVSGVGEGYGRRNDGPAGGVPVSLAPSSEYGAGAAGVGAGGGAAALLAANARAARGIPSPQRTPSGATSTSHVEPFVGMSSGPSRQLSPPPRNATSPTHYQSYPDYSAGAMPQAQHYDDPYGQPQQGYNDPYAQPQQGYNTHPQHDAYAQPTASSSTLPVPFGNAPAATAAGGSTTPMGYPSEKSLSSTYYTGDNMTPSGSTSSVPQQTHYVQNPSPPPQLDHPGPAPSYVTHQPYGAAQSDYGHDYGVQQGSSSAQDWSAQGQGQAYGGHEQQQYGYGAGQQRY